ncbi:helix-turn-helix transcriptional regulator [Sphaerotilus sp.]|uniref:helix-turn-helix transcriptional regulator n=1 Tax=Sphaerotilus sp. TaxID=2093942 RepID=UPI002ACE771E|nr:WYL domain-containing protein [Sphaerotilus sp.]MDZ7857327.1 WYL domain-containing protein [Sphaerotilus sp.]
MPLRDTPHDTLPHRLTQILARLNQGETLEPRALADEFGVNLRTVQRDVCERFAFLGLERVEGGYRLEPSRLGQISAADLERFACLAGIQGLYPRVLSGEFLRELLDSRAASALLVKGPSYEVLDTAQAHTFRLLEQHILRGERIGFRYRKDEGEKRYADVAPYKLINHNGVWYLAGLDGERLKAFAFTKLSAPLATGQTFTRAAHIEQLLEDEDSIWLNEKKTEVVLKVAKDAAGYFRRRKLIGAQVLEKELEDGGVIVSGKVAHPNQILPIVRHWIPHVRIISPEGWQGELERQLVQYLEAR